MLVIGTTCCVSLTSAPQLLTIHKGRWTFHCRLGFARAGASQWAGWALVRSARKRESFYFLYVTDFQAP